MNHAYLTIPVLLAASSLSAQTYGLPGMSYDFVRVGYADQYKVLDTWNVSASCLVAESFILTAGYERADVSSASNFDGNGFNLGLGYRHGIGAGDLILSVGYRELSVDGIYDDGSTLVAAEADADSVSWGIAYRLPVTKVVEFSLGYQYIDYDIGGSVSAAFDGGAFAAAGSGDFNDHALNLSVRFNVTQQFDVTFGYSWFEELDSSWAISAGYNF